MTIRWLLPVLLACLLLPIRADSSGALKDSPQYAAVISPSTLVLSGKAGCVSVHTNVPFDLADTESVNLSGLLPYLVKADSRGELVAKFDLQAVKAMVSPPSATLVLGVRLTTGEELSLADTIVVKE